MLKKYAKEITTEPSLSLETQVNFFNAMPLWGKMQILENLSFKADGLGRGVIQQGSFVSKKKSYPIQNIIAKLKGKKMKEFTMYLKNTPQESNVIGVVVSASLE